MNNISKSCSLTFNLVVALSVYASIILSACTSTTQQEQSKQESSEQSTIATSNNQAITSLQENCDLDNADSCARLGVMYFNGQNVKRDIDRGMQLLQQACDLNSSTACSALGDIYHFGDNGVTKDYSKAQQLLQKGCDLNNALACVQLGVMHIEGLGSKKDLAQGKKLYQKPPAFPYYKEDTRRPSCRPRGQREGENGLSKYYL